MAGLASDLKSFFYKVGSISENESLIQIEAPPQLVAENLKSYAAIGFCGSVP